MKLMYALRNALCATILIVSTVVSAIDVEGLTYIECELRLRERSSRKHQDDFKLTDAKNSSYASFTHPHIPVKEGTSQNWSGYVAVTNISKPKAYSVNAVYGSWVVPTLQSASHNTWCSMWVGFDGYNDKTVEQLGTEHDWYGGQQHDYAWFEMYPNYSYEIVGFPVHPGDVITASVEYQDNNVFLLSIANITAAVHTTIPTSYTTSSTARRRSVEWVMEAPYAAGILPLSHFNTVYFSDCNATIGYMHGPINNKPWMNDMLTMVTSKGTVKAAPSALSAGGQEFSVTWNHE